MSHPMVAKVLTRLPQVFLGVVAIVLMARTDRFFTPTTLGSILKLASIVGVLAAGQAFVLIGGGFDLSQGAALGLVAACTAWLSTQGLPVPLLLASALGLGGFLGSINGFFVATARTNAFVTTLSTLLIFRGTTFALLAGQPIANVRAFLLLDEGITIGPALIAWRSVIFLSFVGVAWVILRRTVFGQHLYATGGNAEAARLAGIRTTRVRIASFAISGMSAGLAAILLLSWVRLAKPDTGTGYELDAIAACVVGGVSLQGGAGSVLGAALGALLLQSLGTLITMSRFPDEYRNLVTGAVILTFATADAMARRSDRR